MIYQTHLINLVQLRQEFITAGLAIPVGVVTWGTWVVQLDEFGDPVEIDASWQYVQDAHIAMRPKTTEEYAAEFPTANPPRKQQINNILTGLEPHEMVPDETSWQPANLILHSGQ